MAFNPNDHVIQLKSKAGAQDYLPVQYRLVWFRDQCPHGTIETEMLHLDLDRDTEEEVFVWSNEKRRSEKVVKQAKGYVLFKATVKDGNGGVATGTKSEKAASFPDFIEKAETGAIGRALAALGYGTQFAPELNEEHRIVDAPVERVAAPEEARAARATPQESVTDRLNKLYELALTSSAIQKGTTAPAFLKLCSRILKRDIATKEQLMPHMAALEKHFNSKRQAS